MSKKQLEHLRLAPALLACLTLLFFPAGIPLPALSYSFSAVISGMLALGIAHYLLKLGQIPPLMRIGVLFPLAFSAPLILLLLPHPFTELWLLLPIALILLSLRHRLKTLPAFTQILCFLLCLSLGAAPYLAQLNTQVHQGLPRLSHHRYIYLSILAIIPLGFATRKMLHPLAKAIARYEIWIGLFLIGLYPIIWTATTACKIPGETERNFHSLKPLPRFYLLPENEIPTILPPELEGHSHSQELLFTLNEMNWRLHDLYIASTFPAQGDIPPTEMLRAMKLYGFLLDDRHGAFLPGTAFDKVAPPEMDPQYVETFRSTMDQIVISPVEVAQLQDISHQEAVALLKEMENLNWVRRVPGPIQRYRLTPQARKPFANGLYPRQLLLLDLASDEPIELNQQSYAKKRGLSFRQKRRELSQLVKLEAAESREVWKLNQHSSFFFQAELWEKTGLYLSALLLALLIGRHLPTHLSKSALGVLTFTGFIFIFQFPLPNCILSGLRIIVGLWIARSLYQLSNEESDRLCLFVSALFISTILMPLSANNLLIHQCLWTLIWFIPAVLLMFFATRPMRIV